ncbi:hypothetical protein SCA6_014329 [Theobroma cacao]
MESKNKIGVPKYNGKALARLFRSVGPLAAFNAYTLPSNLFKNLQHRNTSNLNNRRKRRNLYLGRLKQIG